MPVDSDDGDVHQVRHPFSSCLLEQPTGSLYIHRPGVARVAGSVNEHLDLAHRLGEALRGRQVEAHDLSSGRPLAFRPAAGDTHLVAGRE